MTQEDKDAITQLSNLLNWSRLEKTGIYDNLRARIRITNERFPKAPVTKVNVYMTPRVPTDERAEIRLDLVKKQVLLMESRIRQDPVNEMFSAIDYKVPTEEDFAFISAVYSDLLEGLRIKRSCWYKIFDMWGTEGQTAYVYY